MLHVPRGRLGICFGVFLALGGVAPPVSADMTMQDSQAVPPASTQAAPTATPQAPPVTNAHAGPAPLIGLRNIDPKARAALQRLRNILKNANSIRYESLWFQQVGAQLTDTIHGQVSCSAQRPNYFSIEYTDDNSGPISAIAGRKALTVYNSATKKYAQIVVPSGADRVITFTTGLATAMDRWLTPITFNNIQTFFSNGDYGTIDGLPKEADITVTATERDAGTKRASLYIVESVVSSGAHVELRLRLSSETGLPQMAAMDSEVAGQTLCVFSEEFRSFTTSKEKLPTSVFQFHPPSGSSPVKVSRDQLLALQAPAKTEALKAGLDNAVPAPDFSVVGTDGTKTKLSDFAGRIVVLDFWSTWCLPCQRSLPGTDAIAKAYGPKGVVFLPICSWDTKDKFTAWTNERKSWAMHFYFDGNDQASSIAYSLYKVTGIPTQYVVGADGKILASSVGYMGVESDTNLRTTLDHALNRANTSAN